MDVLFLFRAGSSSDVPCLVRGTPCAQAPEHRSFAADINSPMERCFCAVRTSLSSLQSAVQGRGLALPLASISGRGEFGQPRSRTFAPDTASTMRDAANEEESETVEDSEDSEVLMPRGRRLNKREIPLFCSTCRHSTLFDDPGDLIECSCCHRVFHPACYDRHIARTEKISIPDPDADEPWFHTQACRKLHEGLHREAMKGERVIALDAPSGSREHTGWWPWGQGKGAGAGEAPGQQGSSGSTASDPSSSGYHSVASLAPPQASWRLLQCGALGSPASRIAMSQVYSIISKDFGYTLGDYDSFDLAALLRRDGKPTCAAIVDIHGPDAAEVFVVATKRDARLQGNCRLLMRQLAIALHSAGIQRMVVSLDEGDETATEVWTRLGFTPLENTVMRKLSWSLPAFSSEASEGTLYLGQELRAHKGLLA